ncbi:MAG: PAS domain S-box protein, partial [Planctomycetota bacterium]
MSVRKPTYEELAVRVTTLKSALDESENAREQAEELLFSTLDALPSAIFTFDRAGVIAGWNSSCRDIYGFEDEEVVGKTIYETICRPEDVPATRELIGRVFKGETIAGLEWDDIRKNGSTVHMQTTASPVLDRRGRVVAGMSVNTDVTEHHRAEEALRESEEQYRTVVENVNIGVYRNTGGPHGRFLQANLAIARMFGYDSVEEFMTVHVSDLYQDPEDRKLFVEEALKRGFVKDQELRLRKKDGTPIWASCTAQIEYDEKEEIKWFDGVIEDITERKQAEQALKESEERYRALFEGAAEGILVADADARTFKYANPALCSMLGYTENELTQLGVNDIHPQEAIEHVFAEFEAQVTGRKRLATEIPCLRKDGTVFYADINTTAAIIDGRPCAIGFFRDVTERKQAEEEIRRLNADLGRRVTKQTEEVRESEERYRTLAESAREFIFTADRDFRIKYVNAHMARQARRAADTMIGRTLRDVFPSRAALTMEHHLQSVFKSEQPVHVEEEMRLTESADAPLCLDMRLVPLRDESGEITAVLGIAHDITRRKQAEEALRQSEERMRSIFENALVGIYRTTPAGRILLANPALVRMLGFD